MSLAARAAPVRFAPRGEVNVKMASILLLRGIDGSVEDRYPLDLAAEEALSAAARQLVSFATPGEQGAIAHELDGEIVASWSREGALRLAQLLPPAYAELSNTIQDRYQAHP